MATSLLQLRKMGDRSQGDVDERLYRAATAKQWNARLHQSQLITFCYSEEMIPNGRTAVMSGGKHLFDFST